MKLKILTSILVLYAFVSEVAYCDEHTYDYPYHPSPIDNPLKGLVPYTSDTLKTTFPHSMEFSYIALDDLLDGTIDKNGKIEYIYDFSKLETLLNKVSNRGHSTIFRIYLEYPNKKCAVPQFLVKAGVKIHQWQNDSEVNLTPDYENTKLRKAITCFINEMGKLYDGDPRIAFITAGIIGKWGEWHDYPKSELFASKAVQSEIMQAYTEAFHETPILLRYPAGNNHYYLSSNSEAPFGYHDDSFGWATLDTGKKSDSWYFMAAMKDAGPMAMSKWIKYPIGGEIRPELWEASFTDHPLPKAQDFDTCIRQTHATWLMDTGLFDKRFSLDKRRIENASESVRKMGYEFHIAHAAIASNGNIININLIVKNLGVAPFYYKWPVEIGLLNEQYQALEKQTLRDIDIRNILPEKDNIISGKIPFNEINLNKQSYIGIKIYNPKRPEQTIKFANEYDALNNSGYMILGEI